MVGIRRTPLKRSKGVNPKRAEPVVKVFPNGREVCSKTAAGIRDYQSRTAQMWLRQSWVCAICEMPTLYPTFDHQSSRGMGGSKRDDRIVVNGEWQNAALCLNCNTAKGSKPYRWLNGKYVPLAPHLM